MTASWWQRVGFAFYRSEKGGWCLRLFGRVWHIVRIQGVLLLLPLLGSCVTADRQLYTRAEIIALAGYTRAEVDAINAETACKAQARNLLQVARCEVRR